VTITRTQERIDKTGEVFTPAELVNQMLDRLPAELWTDPTKTFLDNSCGDGNFLVEVVRRKIAAGSTPTQALETTYGVELMADNATLCRQRLLKVAGNTKAHRVIVEHNIACADALTFDYWAPTLPLDD
jgi:type I restriction-modification system DNA methylase subunit